MCIDNVYSLKYSQSLYNEQTNLCIAIQRTTNICMVYMGKMNSLYGIIAIH